MALNNSGTLSIGGSTSGQSINLELGRSATAESSLGETALRSLAGVASGEISIADFYGASSVTLTSFYMWDNNIPKVPVLCNVEDFPDQYYHDGSSATPLLGDKIYTTNATSNPLADGTYAVESAGGAAYGVELESGNGQVDQVILCP
jgi:hypothetical protein